ncbi:MAG: hypothetical protein AAF266_04575 [Planctomycetota bacterium]
MKALVCASLAVALVGAALPAGATPMTTTLSPEDINGADSNTISFADSGVTLTPLQAGTPATFNGGTARLGIDDFGTNVNAFNDPDTDPNNGNEEELRYEFATNTGLSQLVYDFSRADGDGPDDGVVFSGFVSDPGVTFSIGGAPVSEIDLFAVYDAGAGSVRLNIPGRLFGGTQYEVNFDPAASAAQTLLMRTTDTTQGGAQLAIRSISYTVLPEPTAFAPFAVAAAGLAARVRS